jgi:protoporphyrinogen IX oxidase
VPEAVSAAYPWIKAFHVIAVVTWMAGLFYLPRLFVYHAERGAPGSDLSEVFKVMERKLQRLIMLPAMIATWILGMLLILTPGIITWSADGWIYVKLTAVAVLTWFHHWLVRRRRDFAEDRNTVPARHYRLMNEVPTGALFVIVLMVIVKPF